MSMIPPGADFYDLVFATSSSEQQASFLRTLFIKDAGLRSSYYSFIRPPYLSIKALQSDVEKRYKAIKRKIIKYDWERCFLIDPVAEDYYDMITEILERELLSDLIMNVTVSCRIGLLTEAIAYMRVIEMALDADWEELPEPASFTEELSSHFSYLVDRSFLANINDYIYAPSMINNALELIAAIKNEGCNHSNNEKIWTTVASLLRIQLDQY